MVGEHDGSLLIFQETSQKGGQEARPRYTLQNPFPRNPFPPVWPYLLRVPQLSRTPPEAEAQGLYPSQYR